MADSTFQAEKYNEWQKATKSHWEDLLLAGILGDMSGLEVVIGEDESGELVRI